MKMEISVVIPCYCSSATIKAVTAEVEQVMTELNFAEYEIILVNDCSPDKGATISAIRELCQQNFHIKGVDLAKNCGQAAATMAGLSMASGDLIVVGDDDGQTPFLYVAEMYQKMQECSYDVVCANYVSRGHRSAIRNIGSWMAIKMTYYTLEIPKNVMVSVFFLSKSFVVREMLRYTNPYPYILGLITQVTHNIGNIDISQRDRISGQSGYTFHKLLSMWLDGFTAFSIKPLRISVFAGILCAGLGFLIGFVTIVRKLLTPEIMAGYTSMLAATLFIGGIIMLMLGLIGEYIGRIYICLNSRPQYVVKEKLNFIKHAEKLVKK